MRLVTCSTGRRVFLGAQLGDRIVDLELAWHRLLIDKPHDKRSDYIKPQMLTDIITLLKSGDEALLIARQTLNFVDEMLSGDEKRIKDFIYLSENLEFLPPIPRPGKIICVGLNYPDLESAADLINQEYPVLFHKVATSLLGHKQPIVIPRITDHILYEGELALVIGRTGKYITQQEVDRFIAGYTIANDVGAPDLEQRTSQWTSGKMLDTFCPIGPSLVTRDEITPLENLQIRTILNNEIVQDGYTSQMYFDIPYLVSYISDLVTLEPGDIILTGSPKRSGIKPDPRRPMVAGDTVSVEISGLGVLTNQVTAESDHD